MHLHLDPVGGVAGDMFCAAILDAFPDYIEGLRRSVIVLHPPDGWTVDLEACTHPVSGRRFGVHLPRRPISPSRTWGDIRAMLERAPLHPGVTKHALAIFGHLAEAEAAVHSSHVDEVHFHEVGGWDSIIDIVGAAYLIDRLGIVSASCGSLPWGGGLVQSMHGVLPIPAPATLRLLEGFQWHDDGVIGERVTPTGAAILRHLVSAGDVRGKLRTHGVGFGTRTLGAIPNCLRVMIFEAPLASLPGERLIELAFEVDDQTPEDLAQALDRLRALEGVLNVLTVPAVGKAGRLTNGVRLLLRPEQLQFLIDACFRETTTIGLRWHVVDRAKLPRRAMEIEVAGRRLEVKVVERPGGRTAKVEARSLQDEARVVERQRLRTLGQKAALGESDCDE
jgi:uncharacterized protein (TIGR00299 family) protein